MASVLHGSASADGLLARVMEPAAAGRQLRRLRNTPRPSATAPYINISMPEGAAASVGSRTGGPDRRALLYVVA